jgi:hypothetical protein
MKNTSSSASMTVRAARNDGPAFAVDGGDPGVHPRHVLAQKAQLLAHQRAAVVGLDRHELNAAFREIQYLQRTGVLEQLPDVVGDHLLGVDEHVDGHVLAAEEAFAVQVGRRADAGDLGRRAEQRVADLAGHHVDLVAGGHGNQHVRIVCAGSAQHVGMRRPALNRLNVELGAQLLRAPGHRRRPG